MAACVDPLVFAKCQCGHHIEKLFAGSQFHQHFLRLAFLYLQFVFVFFLANGDWQKVANIMLLKLTTVRCSIENEHTSSSPFQHRSNNVISILFNNAFQLTKVRMILRVPSYFRCDVKIFIHFWFHCLFSIIKSKHLKKRNPKTFDSYFSRRQ